jgi:hypothetical protein
MNDLYIYYQVREHDAAELAPRVRAMQQRLGAGQVKKRPQSKDGLQTWMEIYPGTGAGFDATLADAVRDAGLAGLIAGPRHTEIFTDL